MAHDYDNGKSAVEVEVAEVRQIAARADRVANEAIQRCAVLRATIDDRFAALDERMTYLSAEVLAVETRLETRLARLEVLNVQQHEATVDHLSRLWQVAVILRDREAVQTRTPWYALAVVAAIAVQTCGGL